MPHSTALPKGAVDAFVNYIKPPENGKPYPPQVYLTVGSRRQQLEHRDRQPVVIHDIREATDENFQLDTHGFTFTKCDLPVKDWTDHEHAESVVRPEVEAMVKKLSGASHVVYSSHLVRAIPFQQCIDSIDSDAPDDEVSKIEYPAMMVHVDRTSSNASTIAKAMADKHEAAGQQDVADDLRKRIETQRWALVNFWKPIKPIRREPFALLDGRTVSDDDLVTIDMSTPAALHPKGLSARIDFWQVMAKPEHKWWWASYMEPDECYIFKNYDTKKEEGICRWVPHSAFNLNKEQEEGEPPRESVEVRLIAFWDDDKE